MLPGEGAWQSHGAAKRALWGVVLSIPGPSVLCAPQAHTGHPLRRVLCHWPGNMHFLTSSALNVLHFVDGLLVYLVQDDLPRSIAHFLGGLVF